MKNNILFILLFSFTLVSVNAQFSDDMESYSDGDPIITGDGTTNGDWTDWGCGGGPGCAIMSSSAQAYNGSLSGLIPDDGTTDAVLSLGNKIFGVWCLEFWMYVPSNQEGYFNLQGVVPIGAGEWIVGNIHFNQDLLSPGVGLIDDAVGAPINFDFPHDEWFRIAMAWDISVGISLATWGMSVDGVMVVPEGTPFTDAAGTVPTGLGGFDFFSVNTNNLYYLDNINFLDAFGGQSCYPIVSTEDFKSKDFKAYPNPVKDNLTLSADEVISSITITNILGQEIFTQNIDALSSTIDMSSFSKGTYFVKAIIGDTIGTVKIIK